MRWSVVGMIVLGVICSLCATVLVAAIQAKSHPSEMLEQGESNEVQMLVATVDLEASTIVESDSVETRMVPRTEAPENYISNPVGAIGRLLSMPMKKGQAFTPGSLVKEGSRLDVVRGIPKGMRVVSLPLSRNSGLRGLLYPGCIVDVVASFKVPASEGNRSEAVANILIEATKVLAIGNWTIASGDDEVNKEGNLSSHQTNVDLLVEAWQSKPLQLAKQNGTISLAMRHPKDTGITSGQATKLRQMLAQGVSSSVRWGGYQGRAGARSQTNRTSQGSSSVSIDEGAGQWETMVIRGGQIERRVFPMSQVLQGQQNNE